MERSGRELYLNGSGLFNARTSKLILARLEAISSISGSIPNPPRASPSSWRLKRAPTKHREGFERVCVFASLSRFHLPPATLLGKLGLRASLACFRENEGDCNS